MTDYEKLISLISCVQAFGINPGNAAVRAELCAWCREHLDAEEYKTLSAQLHEIALAYTERRTK